jgi:hypothetical protein
MRAMRQTLALCALLLLGGCGDDVTTSGPDLAAPADLAPGADLAVRAPNGVACGQMTCAVGQTCCVTTSGTMATGATCMGQSGQCTGATLACDGPEDCNGGGFCCGTIKFMGGMADGGAPVFQGGNSTCTGTCDFTLGTNQVKTRLCQADIDCAGLTAFGQAVDKCCSSSMAPGLHFCAAPLGIGGITCP